MSYAAIIALCLLARPWGAWPCQGALMAGYVVLPLLIRCRMEIWLSTGSQNSYFDTSFTMNYAEKASNISPSSVLDTCNVFRAEGNVFNSLYL